MSKHDEIEAALAAFNKVRAEVGGIKTEEQQRYAMNEALDAVDAYRKEERIKDCTHQNKWGSGSVSSDGSSSLSWHCKDCGKSGRTDIPAFVNSAVQ